MIARIPAPTTLLDLERYSAANLGWQIERDADGTIVTRPTNSESGRRNARLVGMLCAWNERADEGEVFDSSTGFTMPDGAVLSPDASWIRRDRWAMLSNEQRREYAPIVPDVCVEIVSPSDTFERTITKARRYLGYGAAFALGLDPQQHVVWSEGIPPTGFPSDFTRVIGSDQKAGH